MPFATLTENATARPSPPSFSELIRFVHRQTQQQVRELAIHQRESRLVVTGRSRHLLRQAAGHAGDSDFMAPAVQLVNEISVG